MNIKGGFKYDFLQGMLACTNRVGSGKQFRPRRRKQENRARKRRCSSLWMETEIKTTKIRKLKFTDKNFNKLKINFENYIINQNQKNKLNKKL